MIGYLRRNHLALLALFVALGGTAYAGATFDSADVQNNSLKSEDLKNNKGVKGADVATNTLKAGDVDERSLVVSRIVARVRSNADVSAPQTPATAPYPLTSGASYRQFKGQLEEAQGYAEVFFPAGCMPVGGPTFGTRAVTIQIYRNGEAIPFANGFATEFASGGGGDVTRFALISTALGGTGLPGSTPPPFEATRTGRRTLRATVESSCDGASTARPVVRSLQMDIVGHR